MKFIPDELIESFLLESNSVLALFSKVVIPQVKTGITALTVLTFAENWNMVEQPLIFLEDRFKHPLSLALNSIIQSSTHVAFAGSVIFMLPIIILYFHFEESIISGLNNMTL